MVAPLSQMPKDLAKRVAKIEQAVEKSKRDTLRAAGVAAKAAQQDVMSGDAGGDLRLSRVRSGKGAKIGARFDAGGDSVEVKAIGPVPLIANPIKAHPIPKPGSRRRKVLSIPGIGVRASVNHPGTRGKDTWNRGRESAERKVTEVIGKRTDDVVRRAFQSGG